VCPEAGWEEHTLADYLAGLGEDWRGWEGEREWKSSEAELRLAAIHEKRNTVLVRVAIEGASAAWQCHAEIDLDPGVFEQLAADARRLSQQSP
jgi:hypothetical protein